jgi:hypothetical protein
MQTFATTRTARIPLWRGRSARRHPPGAGQPDYETALTPDDPRYVDTAEARGSAETPARLALKFGLLLRNGRFLPPPKKHVLFFGHTGSGRTTELRRYCRQLEGSDRLPASMTSARWRTPSQRWPTRASSSISSEIRRGSATWTDPRWEDLNLRREALFKRVPVKVLFWLTPQRVAQMARAAPGLWAWRGGVYDFSRARGASRDGSAA